MDEKTFWDHLESRISGEFRGMPDMRLRWIWCDGFIPQLYLLNDERPRIEGRVWMVDGHAQSNWAFTLLLSNKYESTAEIAWETILPPPDMTCWISFDIGKLYLEIEPAVAVPDLK